MTRNHANVEREALTAMRSAPFDPPERGRVAVKIVTATGMEMTAIREPVKSLQCPTSVSNPIPPTAKQDLGR